MSTRLCVLLLASILVQVGPRAIAADPTEVRYLCFPDRSARAAEIECRTGYVDVADESTVRLRHEGDRNAPQPPILWRGPLAILKGDRILGFALVNVQNDRMLTLRWIASLRPTADELAGAEIFPFFLCRKDGVPAEAERSGIELDRATAVRLALRLPADGDVGHKSFLGVVGACYKMNRSCGLMRKIDDCRGHQQSKYDLNYSKVEWIVRDSPADRMGLYPGATLQYWNGREWPCWYDLQAWLDRDRFGEDLVLKTSYPSSQHFTTIPISGTDGFQMEGEVSDLANFTPMFISSCSPEADDVRLVAHSAWIQRGGGPIIPAYRFEVTRRWGHWYERERAVLHLGGSILGRGRPSRLGFGWVFDDVPRDSIADGAPGFLEIEPPSSPIRTRPYRVYLTPFRYTQVDRER